MKKLRILLLSVQFMLGPFVRAADESPSERGFVTDHPGPIDGAKTAPEGKFRIESNVYSVYKEISSSVTNQSTTYGNFFLTRGMTQDSEIQIGIDGIKNMKYGSSDENGLGAFTFRYKYNLVGNDSGPIAIAVMPKLVYTDRFSGNLFAGGVNLPFYLFLPQGWCLAVMPVWDYIRLSDSSGTSQYLLPIVLTYDLTSNFSVFIQHTLTFDSRWDATSLKGLGFAYRPISNLQIDTEFDTGSVDDVSVLKYTLGFSYGF